MEVGVGVGGGDVVCILKEKQIEIRFYRNIPNVLSAALSLFSISMSY